MPSLALEVQMVTSIPGVAVAMDERLDDRGLVAVDEMCTVTLSSSSVAFALGVGRCDIGCSVPNLLEFSGLPMDEGVRIPEPKPLRRKTLSRGCNCSRKLDFCHELHVSSHCSSLSITCSYWPRSSHCAYGIMYIQLLVTGGHKAGMLCTNHGSSACDWLISDGKNCGAEELCGDSDGEAITGLATGTHWQTYGTIETL